jgi:hypothetical protein
MWDGCSHLQGRAVIKSGGVDNAGNPWKRRYAKHDVGRKRSLRRELSVDFAQTILEIAPVMLLPGLHVNFECGVDCFSSLFKFRSIVRPHPQRLKRGAQVGLGGGVSAVDAARMARE